MYELIEYQKIVYDKIKSAIAKGDRKILISAPTGFGKTILSYVIAKNAIAKGNRVLFTNHRITLAEQTIEKFKDLNPELLQGENKIKDENSLLIIGTLQTLLNSEIKSPKIILIDEIHYGYKGELIQSLFVKFPDAIVIGLSATPVDDKDFLLDGFDSIIDDYQTEDLIKLGYLTPFKCYAPFSIDTSNVERSINDFDNKDLEKIINKDNINNSIVDEYIKLGEGRQFICFGVNEIHCKELKKAFELKNIKVEFIGAKTTKNNRDKYTDGIKNNSLTGLISIEILTAGYDEPLISCIIMATATMQWKKYIQCAGRGIRLLGRSIKESIANGKKDCLFLDFCGNIEKHNLPDKRKVFNFGVKISKVLDREFNLDIKNKLRKNISNVITEEKQVYLIKIGGLLDLYDGKVYKKESDLQDDVNNYLNKTNYFYWRQNSGAMYKEGRWISFASKSGLPDNSVFFNMSSIFIGMELKLKYGKLTEHQKKTLPEMISKNILVFIIESVFDVYKAIEHIENNIMVLDEGIFIKNSIYDLPNNQIEYRKKLKLPLIKTIALKKAK
jgi:superfamily II DNA or RNA helicase